MQDIPLHVNGIPIIWIVFGLTILASWLVSHSLKSKFQKYSKIPVNYGLTGKDVAEKMLNESDVRDVKITCINGQLTDHYNPITKSINLSKEVYYGNNVAAAAVAAHEAGHAVQHAHAYVWLGMRSNLVPVVSFASRWMQWVLLAGILLVERFPELLLIGIILFATTTLFSFITLPVEINASKRALVWLSAHNITSPENHPKAQSALRTAAYTYVVAALSSLAALLYYIMIFLNRR
ncbi:MAG: zinc metallopeptidase [Bacteroidales bacterium]|jgi:Zn-dependent membrane protease YugP|nr:zinc metallopeptidase [Bacteroidales bacterium]